MRCPSCNVELRLQIANPGAAKPITKSAPAASTADVGALLKHIDPASLDAGGRVVFGATVEMEVESTGDVVIYQIVGDDEADLKEGKISIGSPIARALIGKEAGDTATVQAPGGARNYDIIEVRYV